eukprot:4041517-Amphidinium_carterae.1
MSVRSCEAKGKPTQGPQLWNSLPPNLRCFASRPRHKGRSSGCRITRIERIVSDSISTLPLLLMTTVRTTNSIITTRAILPRNLLVLVTQDCKHTYLSCAHIHLWRPNNVWCWTGWADCGKTERRLGASGGERYALSNCCMSLAPELHLTDTSSLMKPPPP